MTDLIGDPVPGSAATPWEPPLAGTELEHLLGMLERQRATFRWKADGLDHAGLTTRIGSSALTIGGLLKHLALVEDQTFFLKMTGDSPGGPWDPEVWDADPEWEFTTAAGDSPDWLYGLYDSKVARARQRLAETIADGGIDQPSATADDKGTRASVRRLVCDLIEEYGRHTGHADLLREAVDGRVGEDPPPGWRPVS
ncbi:DUF664 domain-containing protein [Ornithinimicrobium faecis]|uniref:DinB family protein n=1 Tax=Ornithinimicrobium faecis TaxID=2934158 RepID=A0ABY4YW38_9MICO|nr:MULTISPECIES: DUF664 domain-containing protein [unclassified Ornithinimicrobium]USQ80994.1 DinB family protein [Ornithinimicrobium sp. HY1793]